LVSEAFIVEATGIERELKDRWAASNGVQRFEPRLATADAWLDTFRGSVPCMPRGGRTPPEQVLSPREQPLALAEYRDAIPSALFSALFSHLLPTSEGPRKRGTSLSDAQRHH
jgi:hypothetical protein